MTTSTHKKHGILYLILLLSVAANAILGGMVIGKYKALTTPKYERAFAHFESQMQHLPEPTKTEVRKILLAYKPKIKSKIESVREQELVFKDNILSSSYTAEQMQNHYVGFRKNVDEIYTISHELGVKLYSTVPKEHRKRFFDLQN